MPLLDLCPRVMECILQRLLLNVYEAVVLINAVFYVTL